MRSFATSATVSVMAQKMGGELIHPMGNPRGTPTSGGSPGTVGSNTARSGASSASKGTLQKPSKMSCLLMYTGPYLGLACLMRNRMCSKAHPNCMDSMGASRSVSSLMPQKDRSTIRRGCRLRCGTTPSGESRRLGRSFTQSKGRTVQNPCWQKSANSSRTKSICLRADLWGPRRSRACSSAREGWALARCTGAPCHQRQSRYLEARWRRCHTRREIRDLFLVARA